MTLDSDRQPPSLLPIETEPSLMARAREAIRNAIIGGQLAPGSLYSVKALADGFGISRTPVREALIDLANVGMIRFERNRGVRILEYSIRDLEDIFTIRLFLEVPATFRATEVISSASLDLLRDALLAMEHQAQADNEAALMLHDRHFHRVIHEAAGNQRLADHVEHLRDLILTRGVSTVGRSRSLHEIVREHREIIKEIAAKRPDAAAYAMRSHITTTARLLIEQQGGDGVAVEATLNRMPTIGIASRIKEQQ